MEIHITDKKETDLMEGTNDFRDQRPIASMRQVSYDEYLPASRHIRMRIDCRVDDTVRQMDRSGTVCSNAVRESIGLVP